MKGSYILVNSISSNTEITIGALGRIFFKKGFYLYVGSGMGNKNSANLENRLKRHILPSTEKRRHWHIDYLLNHESCSLNQIYIIPSSYRLECIIARDLIKFSDSFIRDFGSSDCDCISHLLYFKEFKVSIL